MFEELEKVVVVEYKITAETTLHIGSGEKDELRDIDLTLLKLPSGEFYIPGSSIKGAVRSATERWLGGLGFDLCIHHSQGVPDYECKEDQSCLSCYLFGSLNFASRTIFRDALLEHPRKIQYLKKVNVSTNRETKTAVQRRLYSLELVPPGTTFRGEIIVENCEDWMLGIIFTVLQKVLHSIGGQVSRGAGKIKIDIERVTVYTPESFIDPTRNHPEIYEGSELEEYIKKCRDEFNRKMKDLKEKYKPSPQRK